MISVPSSEEMLRLAVLAAGEGMNDAARWLAAMSAEVDPQANDMAVQAIVEEVAEEWSVTCDDILGFDRRTRVQLPRQAAMWLVREQLPMSYPEIAAQFGGRDHTTVINAVRRAQARSDMDRAYADAVQRVRHRLTDNEFVPRVVRSG